MATEREIRPTLRVKTPSVPNFLRTAEGDDAIPVSIVSEEDLREIGAAWTEKLVERGRRAQEGGSDG